MPRRSADGIPGSVYADRGFLCIDVAGTVHRPGLRDTKGNRVIAARLKKELWLRSIMGIATVNTTIDEAWARFLVERIHSERSLSMYRLVQRVIRTHGVIGRDMLLAAAVAFRRSGRGLDGELDPTSVNTYLRHFRVFCNWAARTYGFDAPDIASQMIRGDRSQPMGFTPAEVSALTAHPHSPLVALVGFMLATGARPIDALTLTWADVGADFIVWRNKITKEPERRPVSADALRWLPARSAGPVWPWRYSSQSSVNKAFKALCVERGVRPLSLKALRVTFKSSIAHLPFEVQMYLMRHRSADVTLGNYTSVSDEQVRSLLTRHSA